MPDVTLTVDGKLITAPAGTLLIDACKTAGINIPGILLLPRPERSRPPAACASYAIEKVLQARRPPAPPRSRRAMVVADGDS